MIPSWWQAAVLVLAVFRINRLIGWDDFPPVARVRMWAVGADLVAPSSVNRAMGITAGEVEEEWRYRRPLLARMIQCPYCLGFWVSLAVYVWWVLSPTSCLYAAAPFALNAAAALVASHLDP